ncbi:hypothetical protein GCM10018980_06260 [Streptomyces capoamus]|uniref:Uncharacterized protein n=2 Tax=Streptomyces capoamus TaxID=68183 RepID=A0A919C1I1_9ACTN|nr:hypothetical protein GCM10010501_14250 [Streptomyces libani subsp. rufus]GHG35635.1 hypothetical protein GCM10018980_06260 [Streptomyces capoamus]
MFHFALISPLCVEETSRGGWHVLAGRGQPGQYKLYIPFGSATQEVAAVMSAKVLERFPAGAPRGSWPAEEYAAARRAAGEPATVVMDLSSDAFLVMVERPEEDGRAA